MRVLLLSRARMPGANIRLLGSIGVGLVDRGASVGFAARAFPDVVNQLVAENDAASVLALEGNNPIKFARSPEQALAQLLMPPQPGFLEADKAVEDAYLDLQSHQVATLRAIPGALRATLDRFSPGSIRRRAENMGLLARILPGARDAALWRNYEREFVAVKKESDEAFMEVFSKEFRKAYERQLRDGLN